MLRIALCLLLTFGSIVATLSADPRLPAIIGDHMVLQRNMELPIWGWADPSERITVSIGGQRHEAAADRNGRWMVRLKPLRSSTPLTMEVRGKTAITVSDILVGEVWLCSGQSNMQFQLSRATTAEEEIRTADRPGIRLFTVPKESALEARDDVRSAWKIASPETVGDFSAVGYLFGKEIHQALDVPVGLIASSWGGTNAEEWTTPEYMSRDADFRPILDRWDGAPASTKSLYREPLSFDLWFSDFSLLPADGDGDAKPIFREEGGWLYSGSAADGGHRFEIATPGHGQSKAARVHGELKVSDTSMLRVNYAGDGAAVDLRQYRGIRFFVRGRGFFKLHSLQPDVTDSDNYASRSFEAGSEWQPVTVLFEELKQAGWGVRQAFTRDALRGLTIECLTGLQRAARPPSGLYNGMIAPLVPFGIRGAAWYQGEGNAGRAFQYRKLLPTLIESWRWEWRQGDFPFLIVQLPNFRPRRPEPSESAWAELREAQLMALSVPQTGLAVSIDAGEAKDVHPRDKTLVARRLAQWALGKVYGEKVAHAGPFYDSMKKGRGKILVKFANVGGGMVARGGGPLKGFAIAGSDGQFYWADAKISGKTIAVSSLRVPDPVAVRYAWADNPECNLYSKEGLPASPFRTDDWPGVTMNSR
jgi:sialate O-acetylesterase